MVQAKDAAAGVSAWLSESDGEGEIGQAALSAELMTALGVEDQDQVMEEEEEEEEQQLSTGSKAKPLLSKHTYRL